MVWEEFARATHVTWTVIWVNLLEMQNKDFFRRLLIKTRTVFISSVMLHNRALDCIQEIRRWILFGLDVQQIDEDESLQICNRQQRRADVHVAILDKWKHWNFGYDLLRLCRQSPIGSASRLPVHRNVTQAHSFRHRWSTARYDVVTGSTQTRLRAD